MCDSDSVVRVRATQHSLYAPSLPGPLGGDGAFAKEMAVMSDITVNSIDRKLFDEAIRVGNLSVIQSNREMLISRKLLDAVEEAREMLGSGRTQQAYERLGNVIKAVTRLRDGRQT